MSGEVLDLSAFRGMRKQEEETHTETLFEYEAAAKRLSCGHEWVEKALGGQNYIDLVCPKCDTRRGQFIYPPDLPNGSIVWTHNCGSTMFAPVLVHMETGQVVMDLAYANTAKDKCERHLFCYGCGEMVHAGEIL